MSLLSEEELWALVPNADNLDAARAIEAAILAKLAAKELPDPVCWSVESSKKGMPLFGKGWMFSPVEHLDAKFPLFTAAQLHEVHAQGFAAGAAAQLAHEPLCYVRNGEINRWNGLSGMGFSGPLYTRREAK